MKFFLAKTDQQLGMCLRTLYSEGIIQSKLELTTSKKGKLEYRICIDTDHETFEKLKKRYEIMLS